jgi:hypothetical protein
VAEHAYGRVVGKPVQWMTLPAFRDELERTRSVWEAASMWMACPQMDNCRCQARMRSGIRWWRTSLCDDRVSLTSLRR